MVYTNLMPSASEFLEELLVKSLTFVERPHRHEDIAANELVNNLAVGAQTLERHLVVAVITTQLNLCMPTTHAPVSITTKAH